MNKFYCPWNINLTRKFNFFKGEKMMPQSSNSNQKLIPQAQAAIDQMKYEIASEFGVELGPDTTARANGSVGGEITKRLVQFAEQSLQNFR
jgi:small acid-soluble spore protein B (major beta-type SASP)